MGPPESGFAAELPDRVSDALAAGPDGAHEIQKLKVELEAEVAELLRLIAETVRALTDLAESLDREAAGLNGE
jgi:hypothetical protein